MLTPSPKELTRHIEALERFRGLYEPYVRGAQHERAGIIVAMPAAQEAIDLTGGGLVVMDPPALGAHRQTYQGLQNIAFLEERPGFGGSPFSGGPSLSEGVLESIDAAIAELKHDRDEARRRRRSPLYWIDRLLRTLLAIPAYLVSLVVGRSAVEIDRSIWGIPLRVLAIVADALAIYLGGRELGLW